MTKTTKVRNRLVLALAAIALLGSVGYAATLGIIRADENNSHPMIQALAERFGLNEDEVENAFDEIRADHFAEMQERKEDGLNQAVTDGVITEDQKNALNDKHQEMWTERKQERELHRKEMDEWFESQSIDHQALMDYMGGPKGFGHHGFKSGFGGTNSN